tara:strand:- start:110 stop:334 length:225 start_codon:yes stop_codon:yes gene_type:complete
MTRSQSILDALNGGGRWTSLVAVILGGALAVAETGIIPAPFSAFVAPATALIGNLALLFSGNGAFASRDELSRR